MEQPGGCAVDQALLGGGVGQKTGGAHCARCLQVRQRIGEGPYENQWHALGSGRNKLAGSYSDDDGIRPQAAQQYPFARDPLGEHLCCERVAQTPSLVKCQRLPALLVTEIGGEQAELEARGLDVLGVAPREASKDALNVRRHASGHFNGAGHLGKIERLRSEKNSGRVFAYGHRASSGAFRHDQLSF